MKGAATSSGSGGAAPSGGLVVAMPDAVVRLRGRAAVLRRRLTVVHGVLRTRWLRSLQLRVITTTLVISAIVVVVVGFFLMQQITSDQLQAKQQQADVVEDGQLKAETQSDINSYPDARDAPTLTFMGNLVQELQPPADAENAYGVAVVLPPEYSGVPVYRPGDTAGLVYTQIPSGSRPRSRNCRRRARPRPASPTPA